MSPLTDRQRNLLNLINQMSQNTNAVMSGNTERAVDFPSLDLNLDLGGISKPSPPGTTPPEEDTEPTPPGPTEPTTLEELLLSLVNELVEVTTSFGVVAGLLLAVRDDYIVIIEDGAQVLVRIEQIELVSES